MIGMLDVFLFVMLGGILFVVLFVGLCKFDQVKGKLYIKIYGCQMNEYDLVKMVDVFVVSDGLELIDSLDDVDVILVNICFICEKVQEKVFS